MKRLSTRTLLARYREGERLAMVTCYDATFARLVDAAELDMILVGDSLGMVIQGHEHTIPVTLDDMIYHARAVVRGSSRAHVVGDLPFGSYQASPEDALRSAMRLMKEGGVQSVKLEGGGRVIESVARLTEAGIPVVGHLGLTPQAVHQLGGYGLQARTDTEAERLLKDARLLQEAGAFALVLEGIPAPLATRVTETLSIPTIGIGAGCGCNGQVLVIYDLLGLDERFKPRFVKRYASLSTQITDALSLYASEVRQGVFPSLEHSREH